MKTNIKNEEQWRKLEQRFKVLQKDYPEEESIRLLTHAVMEGSYTAFTISRGVDRLVDKEEYCDEEKCNGECRRPRNKNCLKDWLCHMAYPPIFKMRRLDDEEVEQIRRGVVSHY
jgi:hypothetical protein